MTEHRFALAIAAVADVAYAWPAALSLLTAGRRASVPVVCILVGDDIPRATQTALQETFRRHLVEFRYVASDLSGYAPLPLETHLSRATYGRLVVPVVTADLAPRTLYLDSDTLTVGDVEPLSRLPLESRVLAAVVSGTVSGWYGVPDWRERGIRPDAPFFNAGVLLIDNQEWQTRNISEQVVELLTSAPESARFADQGALNTILVGRWVPLQPTWNYCVHRSPSVKLGPIVLSRRFNINLRHTRIIHFFEAIKPWDDLYPPGALTRLYRDAWKELLPNPLDPPRTVREWLRDRHGLRQAGDT